MKVLEMHFPNLYIIICFNQVGIVNNKIVVQFKS